MSTTTTARRLSKPQREMLTNAIAYREGRVLYENVITMGILQGAGYIEEVLAIRDQQERRDTEIRRDNFIFNAKESLAAGDWKAALRHLAHAQRRQQDLDEKVWWITDAGRAALGAA